MHYNRLKKILKNITGLTALQFLYWIILRFDAGSCAELPQVKRYKMDKADRWYPF